MTATPHDVDFREARPGDHIEVRGLGGGPTRKGRILELLGRPGHEHYRVCWNDGGESIFFPADGVHVTKGHPIGVMPTPRRAGVLRTNP